MPTIKVPQNIQLLDLSDQPVLNQDGVPVQIDFAKSFLLNTVLNDAKFGSNLKSLYVAIDLAKAFEKSEPGSEVLISQDGWEKLKEVVSEPSAAYNVTVMRQAKSFFDAIMNPEKK
jgi:hypothetical protein